MTDLVRTAAAVTTLSLACAHGPNTRAAAEPRSIPAPQAISLSEVKAGQWTIVFRTSRPTADLRFVRNPDDSRARRWQVEHDFELIHEQGADFLRRKDGGVFQTASVTVPARYVALLGRLPFKPMLFASLDPAPPKGSGFDMQGGTLPGQVFFHLYGEKWAESAQGPLLERLSWNFAHEAGHLFQSVGSGGGVYPMDQSWIHEGSAEAFAALTVSEFSGVSCGSVEERIEGAMTECAAGLEALPGRSLNASAQAGAFVNYYTCGLVIQLAIDAETKRNSAGARDLFDVWAEFLSRARAGEPINQDTFLRTASELGAVNAASFARALVSAPQDDPLHLIRTGLNEHRRLCPGGGDGE